MNDPLTERAALRARVEELTAGLIDARESIEAWGAYVSDYFKEKHDFADDLARIDAALTGGGDE